MSQLEQIANEIVAAGKGILAADESFPTIEKRFKAIDVPSTEANRRDYREMLFRTSVGQYISGVILFDETLRQDAADGKPLRQLLAEAGIHPGIKVDRGTHDVTGRDGEKLTQGLDGLRERLAEYAGLGATFAKWRAVYSISDVLPSEYLVHRNARDLASYAALCQEQGLVPIVEPEVLMDGSHGIDRCAAVTERVLVEVYRALNEAGVLLEGTLLKPNMVISGKDCAEQAGPEQVGARTIEVLRRTVPGAVPGIVFLSGGQTEQQATANLNAMNAAGVRLPWELSFSYGRALQQSAISTWKGEPANVPAAQQAYHHRAAMNGAARYGKYTADQEATAVV